MRLHPGPEGFLEARFFSPLAPLKSASDLCLHDKYLSFEAEDSDGPVKVLTASLVSSQDNEAWKACRELILTSVKSAALQMRGYFTLHILSLDLIDGIRHFNASRFTQLMVNHGASLEPGQPSLFRFGQIFCVLTKRVPGDSGKIDTSFSVESYTKMPDKLDLWLNSAIKKTAAGENSQRLLLVVHDLSAQPIFRFGLEPQTERLAVWLDKMRKENEKMSAVYWIHADGAVELFEQFGLQ